MVMDQYSAEFLKTMEDKEIAKLLRGVYMLFDSKFPPENYNIKAKINKNGYHMDYLGVTYSISFYYNNNWNFRLNAELPNITHNLEERLTESKVSNKKLDKTKYISNQRIYSNGNNVDIYCKLKSVPSEEKDINFLCDQLWGQIIRIAMSEITKQ